MDEIWSFVCKKDQASHCLRRSGLCAYNSKEVFFFLHSYQEDRMATIDQTLLAQMHKYWNAANYLTVGQIYLQDNPLLREPLRREHIKPRLLGHWGTSPGLSFIYAHLNRLILERDANVIYLAGPGHGGPAIVANVYLEGTYSEIYPEVSHDVAGLRRLCRQFSTPGGIPSHVSVPTPGSIQIGRAHV